MKLYNYASMNFSADQTALLRARKGLVPGVGLEIDRGAYRHYAIYAPGDTVIELSASTDGRNKARRIPLKQFMLNNKAKDVRIYQPLYPKDVVIKRAEAIFKLKKLPYNLMKNNCEHFMNEIMGGKHYSHQVDGASCLVNGFLRPIFKANQAKSDIKYHKYYTEAFKGL